MDRTHATLGYLVADVDAKHGRITGILSIENAWTAVAFFTLALFGDGGQDFGRIGFVKMLQRLFRPRRSSNVLILDLGGN
jgi:hypothetical protein